MDSIVSVPEFTYLHCLMRNKIANSVDPDQTIPLGSILGLYCLFMSVCLSEY